MKKVLFLLMFPIFVFGQYTSIPDINFENALKDLGYDDVIDGKVLTVNISSVDSLDVSYNSISDLKGIENFTSLTFLNCLYNELTSLDVSQNKYLTSLNCSSNELTSLDVSQNKYLTSLNFSNNELTSLDVSQNKDLKELQSRYNQLKSLDVSQNKVLGFLSCTSNELKSLDFRKNKALYNLSCEYNELESLDVRKNKVLGFLSCDGNRLKSLDFRKNKYLMLLECTSNELKSLDVSQNKYLRTLFCSYNQLITLDVTRCNALIHLECDENKLTSLDVSQNKNLKKLRCENNQLTSLDVSKSKFIIDKRDGKKYETVIIGNQEWMAQNLAYKPTNDRVWTYSQEKYWAYDNDSTNVAQYGYLYGWRTAKNVCPTGWHLPSDDEWFELTDYLGGAEHAGVKMKSTSGWKGYDTTNSDLKKGVNGTNESGFNALPGGRRTINDGKFQWDGSIGFIKDGFSGLGVSGGWWSSSGYNSYDTWARELSFYYDYMDRNSYINSYGLSVRCIRD